MHFPKGWEDAQAQFLGLFHRYAYIYRWLEGDSWYSAKDNWKLTDTEILKAIAGVHQKFLGCRSGTNTRFAVLDIDAKSRYHSKHQLDRLLKVLSKAGLTRSSLYRSSYSGGWHLYIFFDEPINSKDLRTHLVKVLTLNNFEIAKGTLEVFPFRSDASLGLGLRLPLQPGFAWLDKADLEVMYERAELSATKALEFFLDALDADANSFADFKHLKAYAQQLDASKSKANNHGSGTASNVLPLRRSEETLKPSEFASFVESVFGRLPPGIIADNWYKGRLYHLYGLAGPSQRAEAITTVGHYFFYGDPSRNLPPLGYGYEQERDWALNKFLSAKHNGQSKDINEGRADAMAQIERAANWRPQRAKLSEPKKYSAERPIAWIRGNENRKKSARQRIQSALDDLKKQQRVFTTVELQEKAECSRRTLYDHQDIWRAVYEDRKNYRDLSSGFFANCTGEYNDAVGAAPAESKPPSASLSKNVPPGLLAARRIAYEISMRRDRDIQKDLNASRKAAHSWTAEVDSLTSADLPSLAIQKLRALLAILLHYLSIAPCKEDEESLHAYVSRLREELNARSENPHPAPDSG
jgi:hypothetical protein